MISPATAGEIIQKAISANLQFKKDRGVKDYALAKEYGTSQRNIKKLLQSTKAETVDRITKALINLTGVEFDPFKETI